MIINSITLKNFLCYYGAENIINFSKGLNLILGGNGYGKSKLYDAFQWVLLNRITNDQPGGFPWRDTASLKRALISERALAEAQIGDKVECEVTLDVTDGVNVQKVYRIINRYVVIRKSDIEWHEPSTATQDVYERSVLRFTPLEEEDAKRIISKLMPTEVLPYMWFQGEKGVNNLINASSAKSLKELIEKLSDVTRWDDYIEIARMSYETAENEFRRVSRSNVKIKNEVDNLTKSQDELRIRLQQLELDKLQYQHNKDDARKRSEGVIGQLQSARRVNDYKKEVSQCEQILAEKQQEYERVEQAKPRKLFTEAWILEGTAAVFEKFEAKLKAYSTLVIHRNEVVQLTKPESERSQTRLPPGIPEKFHVLTMLEEQHCKICNRPAMKGTPEYAAIQSLIPSSKPAAANNGNIEPELRALYNRAGILLEKSKGAVEGKRADLLRQNELDLEMDELREKKSQLEDKLRRELFKGDDDDDIINRYENASRDIENYSAKLSKTNSKIESIEEELLSIESQLKKLSRGSIDPKLSARVDMLSDLYKLAIRIKKAQYEKLIFQLENEANLHYKRMNEDTGAPYGRIVFVPTTNEGIFPQISHSDGERMELVNTSLYTTMKLAIIMAVVTANSSRGYARLYPLISDAPISDFDPRKARAFLKETANTFTQSIIILKDFLDDDPNRTNRYTPDKSKIKALKTSLEEIGKPITMHLLDIPDGQSADNRRNLTVKIKQFNI